MAQGQWSQARGPFASTDNSLLPYEPSRRDRKVFFTKWASVLLGDLYPPAPLNRHAQICEANCLPGDQLLTGPYPVHDIGDVQSVFTLVILLGRITRPQQS